MELLPRLCVRRWMNILNVQKCESVLAGTREVVAALRVM